MFLQQTRLNDIGGNVYDFFPNVYEHASECRHASGKSDKPQ